MSDFIANSAYVQENSHPASTSVPRQALERGLSIIPLSEQKKPLLERWKEFQTRLPTQEELAEWEAHGAPLWGVITGAISGVIVLDFDGNRGVQLMRQLGLNPHVRT